MRVPALVDLAVGTRYRLLLGGLMRPIGTIPRMGGQLARLMRSDSAAVRGCAKGAVAVWGRSALGPCGICVPSRLRQG